MFRLRQRSRDFLANNESAHRRRNYRINSGVRKKRRQRLPQLLGKARILQDQRALDICAAVQPAGQLKVAMTDGARRLEHLQQFFAFQHLAHLAATGS